MSRLDIRIKTELPAWVTPCTGETEEKVTVHELSLGGLLMSGWEPKSGETLLIRMALSKNYEVAIFGDVVWTHKMISAVRFYCSEQDTSVQLWQFIKEHIHNKNKCPYCNHESNLNLKYCEACHCYLNFSDPHYIDNHMKETFFRRVTTRTGNLESQYLLPVLNQIDRTLLSMKGLSFDEQFVGTSENMLNVFSMIRKIAPTESPVLILGESGTGKDITARAIHDRSQRRLTPFVVINCAAIPENLLEAELFGYERGAFTGAYTGKKGKFELAHGGTVFLDEIAELSLPLQVKLLRVLENKTVDRLGGTTGKKVDVRIITATSKNIEQEVANGKFRIDLYYRINTFTILLPPLRERREDKEVIAKYYLAKFCAQEGISKQFSHEALNTINQYVWPGNVRELINKIRRAMVISEGSIIMPSDFSIKDLEKENVPLLAWKKARIEKHELSKILQMNSYNVSKSAKLLGISRPTLYSLIRKYEIKKSKGD